MTEPHLPAEVLWQKQQNLLFFPGPSPPESLRTALQKEADFTYCLYWTSNTVPGGICASVSHVRMFSKFVEANVACFRHDDLSAAAVPRQAKRLALKLPALAPQPRLSVGPALPAVSRSARACHSLCRSSAEQQFNLGTHTPLQLVNSSQRKARQEPSQREPKTCRGQKETPRISHQFKAVRCLPKGAPGAVCSQLWQREHQELFVPSSAKGRTRSSLQCWQRRTRSCLIPALPKEDQELSPRLAKGGPGAVCFQSCLFPGLAKEHQELSAGLTDACGCLCPQAAIHSPISGEGAASDLCCSVFCWMEISCVQRQAETWCLDSDLGVPS